MQIVPILTHPLTNQEKCNLRTIIVIADIHQGLQRSAAPHSLRNFARFKYLNNAVVERMRNNRHCLTFWHWSSVTPYTSSCEFAGSCVFDKQSPGIL